MTWIEVIAKFEQAPEDWSPYVDVFRDFGCENTLQTDQPPTLSSAVVAVDGAESVVRELTKALRELGVESVESRDLVETNWEENWKQFFKPRRIGSRIVVRPTWETFDRQPDDLEIVLDPGQAFGTGDHPTTRMCLELMQEIIQPGQSVADVGCGSGILSVAACKLGANPVVGIDIEPLSVEVAKENAKLNDVEFEAIVGNGVKDLSRYPLFDVVVSNIISATLINIAHEVADVCRPGGYWVVSGIIVPNWQDVQVAANRAGFELVREMTEGDWVGAIFRKAS